MSSWSDNNRGYILPLDWTILEHNQCFVITLVKNLEEMWPHVKYTLHSKTLTFYYNILSYNCIRISTLFFRGRDSHGVWNHWVKYYLLQSSLNKHGIYIIEAICLFVSSRNPWIRYNYYISSRIKQLSHISQLRSAPSAQ